MVVGLWTPHSGEQAAEEGVGDEECDGEVAGTSPRRQTSLGPAAGQLALGARDLTA